MSKYSNVKLEHDFVLVQIESEMNEWVGEIKDDNGKVVKLAINTSYHPTHHARICAKVVAVPERLSKYLDPLYEIYPGSPRPVQKRDSALMQKQFNALPKHYRKTHGLKYICGGYVPEYKTLEGEPVEVPVGSTIYFHYNTLLKEENYVERLENGDLLYRIPYQAIFCYVNSQGEIIMLNNYCLVTPYFDEKTQELELPNGQRVFGRMKGDLIVSLEDHHKYLTGVLRHKGRPIGPDSRNATPINALIMYRPSSEFVNNIEGYPFYVMRITDIVAEWIEDSEIELIKAQAEQAGFTADIRQIIPVGDYVMISPEKQSVMKQGNQIIFDPNNPHQKFNQGDLFIPDNAFSHDKKKKKEKFGIGQVQYHGELCKKDRTGQKVMYEKSGYYLYVEEFNVVFVREGDIYGTFES